MKSQYKNEILAAVLGGAISGAICLIGLLFVTPERWYLSLVVGAILGGVIFAKSVSEKKKNSGRFERDEYLIDFPYIYAAEGYLRGESDLSAKFYFGEDEIGVLYYKNVRPITESFSKNRIKAAYMDRSGWFSIVVENEKRRMVIPKGEAEKAASVLEEMLGEK